jgi:sec-independent protein translocase protein TatA
MFNVGPGELLVIMALALIFFGPKKLPEIGRSIGNAMREFRRASNEFMDAVHNQSYEEEHAPPVKHVEYPEYAATPALSSPENYETLPYGADFYPAETHPSGDAEAVTAEQTAGTAPAIASANGESHAPPSAVPGAVAAAAPAGAEPIHPGEAGTHGAAVSPEGKA